MKDANEFDTNAKVCMLIAADPGQGKTSLALQLPSPYVMDCDNNLRPAVRFTGAKGFKYDVAHEKDDGTLIEPKDRYKILVERITAAAQDENIKTIIIDTIGSLADIVCSEVKQQQGRKDNDVMRIQDWGDFLYLMRNFIIKLKASGKHIVFTAHSLRSIDEATKVTNTFINVPGQIKQNVSGMFSDVWLIYSEVKGFGANAKHQRMVRTIPINNNDHRGAKDSLGLPPVMTLEVATDKLKEYIK